MGKKELEAFDKVQMARDIKRPRIQAYCKEIFQNFIELKGDRLGKEDPSIYGGIASFQGKTVMVIGHRKGQTTQENICCNFGMPNPEGYRKAMRLMKMAEKFQRPLITWIDTPGAYPGMEAEENGQSMAIAESMALMSRLTVPVIVIVTGEGSSGGALAIGVGNSILMLENAIYSVLSPEGFASILWKDAKKSRQAAAVMQLTADELYEAGLIDGVIREPEGGIQSDPKAGMKEIKKAIAAELNRYKNMTQEEIKQMRYEKFRHLEGTMTPVDAGMKKEHLL